MLSWPLAARPRAACQGAGTEGQELYCELTAVSARTWSASTSSAPGPGVRIADGTTANVGDLIAVTRNDHSAEAGEPGRTLANGDLLRIDAVTGGGLLVRRALDADPETGQRRWTDRQFLYADYGKPSWATRSPTAPRYRPSPAMSMITPTARAFPAPRET